MMLFYCFIGVFRDFDTLVTLTARTVLVMGVMVTAVLLLLVVVVMMVVIVVKG